MLKRIKLKAFTLAEVLITLAIIGVVAAMTIPTLMKNYQKSLVEKRLVNTYAVIVNMFKLAEVDHGDPSKWGMDKFAGITSQDGIVDHFINTFMMPYLQGASYKDRKTAKDWGYPDGIKNPDGSVVLPPNATPKAIRLKNGVYIFPAIASSTRDDVKYFFAVNLFIDIDGPAGSNVVGKDVYQMQQLFDSVGPHLSAEMNWDRHVYTGVFTYKTPFTRQELFDYCAQGDHMAKACGALIKKDGWKIKDDYPWF